MIYFDNAATTIQKSQGTKDAVLYAMDHVSNATEGLNTALNGLLKPGDHVVCSAMEHNSVLRPLYRLEEQGVKLTIIPADKEGVPNYKELEKVCQNGHIDAIVMSHASNLTGYILDVSRVKKLPRKQIPYLFWMVRSRWVLFQWMCRKWVWMFWRLQDIRHYVDHKGQADCMSDLTY